MMISCQLRYQAQAPEQFKQKLLKEKQKVKVSISKTVACENCAVGRGD